MKDTKLIISDIKEYDEQEDFELGISPMGAALNIYIDGDNTLEDRLKEKSKFKEVMENDIEYSKNNELLCTNQTIEEWTYFYNIFDNLIEKVDYIELDLNTMDELEYIKNNSKLKNKKIIIREYVSLEDEEKLDEISEKYREYKDNIYVDLEGNVGCVSLDDCYKTIEWIKNTCNFIKSLNLSPIETVMYTYDLVRNRKYKEENENESKLSSRDLTPSLFGENIVCVGYSNEFLMILKYLGFENNNTVTIRGEKDPRKGHEFNVLYVKDNKYNIDGCYFFDLTADSKLDDTDKWYLYSYGSFAKTMNYLNKVDYNNKLKFDHGPVTEDEIYNLEELVNNHDQSNISKIILKIDYAYELVYKEEYIGCMNGYNIPFIKENLDQIIDDSVELIQMFNNDIPGEIMLEILRNVRKVEYYLNPEYYPYDVNSLYTTSLISFWDFVPQTNEERLLRCIFGYTVKDRIKDTDNYFKKNQENIEKEVAQVKLTRTLRNCLNSKAK